MSLDSIDRKGIEVNGMDRFISDLVHYGMFKNTEWQNKKPVWYSGGVKETAYRKLL